MYRGIHVLWKMSLTCDPVPLYYITTIAANYRLCDRLSDVCIVVVATSIHIFLCQRLIWHLRISNRISVTLPQIFVCCCPYDTGLLIWLLCYIIYTKTTRFVAIACSPSLLCIITLVHFIKTFTHITNKCRKRHWKYKFHQKCHEPCNCI